MRAVIDEKAIECDSMRKRLSEAAEAAQKTVDKDLAKNIVLKYLALPCKFSSFGRNGEIFQIEVINSAWTVKMLSRKDILRFR